LKIGVTKSPEEKLVTEDPVAMMVPAPSEMGITSFLKAIWGEVVLVEVGGSDEGVLGF